jgi:hypothetical protein
VICPGTDVPGYPIPSCGTGLMIVVKSASHS